MATTSLQTDKGIGLAMACVAVTLVGAVIMYGAGSQAVQAWGFAGAMLAASLGVVALHVYQS